MREPTFGEANEVHAHADAASHRDDGFDGPNADGSMRRRIEAMVAQWDNRLRDRIVADTALPLSSKGRVAQTKVMVVDFMPPSLLDIIRSLGGDSLLLDLILRRDALVAAGHVLEFVAEAQTAIDHRLFDGEMSLPPEHLRGTLRYLERILEALRRHDVTERLRGLHHDILGSYRPPSAGRTGHIFIYWRAIALAATLLRVSPDDLAIVTLAHERAHAVTHVGFDADGRQWDTRSLLETDLSIVEGLAQYYTDRACLHFNKDLPELHGAFRRLLDVQSEPYCALAGVGLGCRGRERGCARGARAVSP
jgi:hypothetical protein